jgi:LysR family transcriptional regulator, nitrogen assimilation regulatory protein
MDLPQLRYFLHAAKTQNLTHASSKAWISQSAISRQIKLLESELGVILFERKARGVKLTDAGITLAARAEQLLQDADELKRVVSNTNAEPSGTLRIGAPTSLCSVLMAPLLQQFHQEYPSVLLTHKNGTSKGIRDALADGELDLAIVADQESVQIFARQALFSEALCLVSAVNAGLRMQFPATLKQLAKHPLILTAYPNSLRVIVDRAMHEKNLTPQSIIETDTANMMLDLVQLGVGSAVLPASGVARAVEQGLVSACPIRNLRIQWILAHSRERSQTAASLRAVALLREMTEVYCNTASAGTAWLPS